MVSCDLCLLYQRLGSHSQKRNFYKVQEDVCTACILGTNIIVENGLRKIIIGCNFSFLLICLMFLQLTIYDNVTSCQGYPSVPSITPRGVINVK